MDSTELINNDIKTYKLLNIIHIIVLSLCIILIIAITLDLFGAYNILSNAAFMRIQLFVCCSFIADFFIELFLYKNKGRYIKRNIIFLIVSIPYSNIFELFNIEINLSVYHFIRFIPLIRGAYALALIVSWFSKNTVSTLFTTYIAIMISNIFFSSLIFYCLEKNINSMVNNFGDATWWAFMNVTTVGSNIYAVTTVGKILSVCLAAMGMMMFPIFTVYITDRIQEINKKRRRDLFLKIINERNNKTPNIGVQENKTPENTDDVNLNK